MFDMSVWSWPQWTMFLVTLFNLGSAAVLHGNPRTGTHSFPIAVFGCGLGLFILMYGGFYS